MFSSAFTRTQLSAQALLSGLLERAPHLKPEVRVLPPERDMIYSAWCFAGGYNCRSGAVCSRVHSVRNLPRNDIQSQAAT